MFLDLSIHRSTLHKTLHLPNKLPADFEGMFINVPCYRYPPNWWDEDRASDREIVRLPPFIANFTIVIKKGSAGKGRSKSSAHRVFVKCKCGREVPSGRMSQHRCDHWPTKEIVDFLTRHGEKRKAHFAAGRPLFAPV